MNIFLLYLISSVRHFAETEKVVEFGTDVILFLILYIFYLLLLGIFNKFMFKRSTITDSSDFTYNTDCPICFNHLKIPIKSSCSHAFCLDCLYAYTQINANWKNMCPYCRTVITHLSFVKDKNFNSLTKIKKIKMENRLQKIKILQNHNCFQRLKCTFGRMNKWVMSLVLVLIWFYAVKCTPLVYEYIYCRE